MDKIWDSNSQLFESIKKNLFSAVIGDVMDKIGLRHQFLPARIQPLSDQMVVVGSAMPVLVENTEYDPDMPVDQAYGLLFSALDDLKADEVYLCTGADPSYALWGELMSTRAIQLKAAGAVVDGYTRDTPGILKLNFPTFSYGRYAQDQAFRGKVVDFRTSINIQGVAVQPGDIVFGDLEGVCIIPHTHKQEVIELALEKVKGEHLVRKALESGMSASEAFKNFGIM
ncbi:MAG: demethylmenaquinone methyltransferase [Cyclobacteriaceae bacterium]|nr:MAG: demethylmenaquinone methyltransferase [Cyclobacteriaceae bacterium]